MKIAGLQKLTLLDFPGHTAATVFTPGCNLRCPFCYNADLVIPFRQELLGEACSTDEFFAFLEKRRGLLDGVCITGGEPTLQPDLITFCKQIQSAGFKVKLDTNGCNPTVLEELIAARLIDYVALDVKNTPARYAETVGRADFDLAVLEQSMLILATQHIPHEYRTTVVRELHAADDLLEIARWIARIEAKDTVKDEHSPQLTHRTPSKATKCADTLDTNTPKPAEKEEHSSGSPCPAQVKSEPEICTDSEHQEAVFWYLQNFDERAQNLVGTATFSAWDETALRDVLPYLRAIFSHTKVRGL